MAQPEEMYQCQTVNCGYIYDPDRGDRKGKIPRGTQFKDLPDDWKCPVCGASKKIDLNLSSERYRKIWTKTISGLEIMALPMTNQ